MLFEFIAETLTNYIKKVFVIPYILKNIAWHYNRYAIVRALLKLIIGIAQQG